jgi:hypothetical protein
VDIVSGQQEDEVLASHVILCHDELLMHMSKPVVLQAVLGYYGEMDLVWQGLQHDE